MPNKGRKKAVLALNPRITYIRTGPIFFSANRSVGCIKIAPHYFVFKVKRPASCHHMNHNVRHHQHRTAGIVRQGSFIVDSLSSTCHGKKDLVIEPVTSKWWQRIRDHQGSQQLESHFANSSALSDADSDWFFLRLAPFNIKTNVGTCDIEFSFEDFDNSNNNNPGGSTFRQGVVWDFIELKQNVKLFNC